ncbi:MAG: hypothetical protein ACI8QS_000545 [Planctomycetota bacterium]|jgi:hypothetical protein
MDALLIAEDGDGRACFDANDKNAIEATLARCVAADQTILRTASGSLPPLYRLRSFEETAQGLSLRLGRTDYGEYLFSNVEHPERRAERGDDAMSDALAVCAVLVTGDGFAVYGPRSSRIADLATDQKYFHVLPSGHPEPPQGIVDGLFTELQEEAGVHRGEVQRALLTGLIRAQPSGKPELTFLLETRATLADIRSRSARDAWEFDSIEGFPWTQIGAREWLTKHRRDAVAPGHAAIALAARLQFGS